MLQGYDRIASQYAIYAEENDTYSGPRHNSRQFMKKNTILLTAE